VKHKTIFMGCDTKTCISNENGECKEAAIEIKNGKCIYIRSKNDYRKDGTYKHYIREE
jgi:hypothetical protein